ncbi:MAG TPA: penicillin-binding transpeptidase domain-containing protein [Chloroflexota bacterium]|nr:penicillin-binding transpeptidase domain-containing protein [Chloroflexota bacterium]
MAATTFPTGAAPPRPLRLGVLFAVFAAIGSLLVARLVYWQVLDSPRLKNKITAQHQLDAIVPARRGGIFDVNRDLLAGSVSVDYIYAQPSAIKKPEEAAARLATVLEVTPEELLPALSDTSRPYVRLLGGRKVSPEVSEKVSKLRLPGIFLEPTTRRTYPGGPLAAHLLGFVDNEGAGWYGLEGQYGGQGGGPVGGKPGHLRAERDTAGNEIAFSERQWQPPEDGMDLVLTIDRTIQYIAERELDRAIAQHQASGGTVIVMDPKTGAVLAMASRPGFDPNKFDEFAQQTELFANPAVTLLYEPGSTFKVMTMAAALNEKVVTPETTYVDNGVLSIGGFTIRNWDGKANGVTNMTQLLEKSSNIGASWIALNRLGADRFYRYVTAFGFGQPTGIDLQGEGRGIVKDPKSRDWAQVDLATNSFGQAISVTPLQIASAVSAIANGGIMMRPYVVRQIVDPNTGKVVQDTQPHIVRQVISREAASTLLTMLHNAAENGETRGTLVPGFKVAGKTGTAQIPDLEKGGYDPNLTIASFVGAVPADDPQFVILVKIDKPLDEPWGSLIAKPAFAIIGQELTRYKKLRPTEPIKTPTPSPVPRASATPPARSTPAPVATVRR